MNSVRGALDAGNFWALGEPETTYTRLSRQKKSEEKESESIPPGPKAESSNKWMLK